MIGTERSDAVGKKGCRVEELRSWVNKPEGMSEVFHLISKCKTIPTNFSGCGGGVGRRA